MDVRTLCLGVLTLGDASGYEIKKTLEGPFHHFYDASFGSIYPALNRLQSEGFVNCNHESQSKRPDKKVYSLTADGRLAFLKELSEKPAPDRVRSEFLVMMTFADLLPVRHVAEIVDARLKTFERIIDQLESSGCEQQQTPANQFVSGYGLAVYRAARDYLRDNRYLVEGESLLSQVRQDRGDPDDSAYATGAAAE